MRVLVDGVVGRTVLLFGAVEDPGAGATWGRGVTLGVDDGVFEGDGAVGVVGVAGAGLPALAFAGRRRGQVDRVVLVGSPIPEDDELSTWGLDLSRVDAKVLLLYGPGEARQGGWWRKRLPGARLEMNPEGYDDLLAALWHRVLSFTAPRCKRGS